MSSESACVISLFGPTAVGKTEVAIEVAQLLKARGIDAVAISADAFQLYRGLEVISGAPSAAERERLEHLLVGTCEPTVEMSAGRYAEAAHAAIDGALADGRLPIVVGGSGLYMQAALSSLEMRPPVPVDSEGADGTSADDLHRRLSELAPEAAAQISRGDSYRTGRALALAQAGSPADPGGAFWESPLRHRTLRVVLMRNRPELYGRIDDRVDRMVREGALQEVLALDPQSAPTAARIIGFEELPEGEVELMKLRTRRYAKRQVTWARRIPGSLQVDLSSTPVTEAARLIVDALPRRPE